jgi:16S rRNA (uracil1498-N3)-methyltransferase
MIIFYTDNIDIENQTGLLNDTEWIHCHKVLRHKVGDEISIMDGKGNLYLGSIIEATKKQGNIKILQVLQQKANPIRKCIAICPTKNMTRTEWMIEKSVEMGITDILLFHSHRTERAKVNFDRTNKIILSAAKQSMNLWLPALHYLVKYKDALAFGLEFESKYIAHCHYENEHLLKLVNPSMASIVFIGPEGDFTTEEVQAALSAQFIEAGLGDSRLRTETAGVAAAHILNLANYKL